MEWWLTLWNRVVANLINKLNEVKEIGIRKYGSLQALIDKAEALNLRRKNKAIRDQQKRQDEARRREEAAAAAERFRLAEIERKKAWKTGEETGGGTTSAGCNLLEITGGFDAWDWCRFAVRVAASDIERYSTVEEREGWVGYYNRVISAKESQNWRGGISEQFRSSFRWRRFLWYCRPDYRVVEIREKAEWQLRYAWRIGNI